MGFRPMLYDPMYLGRDQTPTVRDVVEFFDKVNAGQSEKPRNLAMHLSETERAAFLALHTAAATETQMILQREMILTLVTRQLMQEERFSEERAQVITQYAVSKYGIPVNDAHVPPCDFVLRAGSELHFTILKEMYVTSMQLHQEDFEALFTSNGCIHDPDLVFARMKDPRFRVSDEQRAQHFTDNRDTAFNLMMSFGGYMVEQEAINPKVKMMAMATIYRVLQGVFDPEALKQADARTEMDDKVKKIAAKR